MLSRAFRSCVSHAMRMLAVVAVVGSGSSLAVMLLPDDAANAAAPPIVSPAAGPQTVMMSGDYIFTAIRRFQKATDPDEINGWSDILVSQTEIIRGVCNNGGKVGLLTTEPAALKSYLQSDWLGEIIGPAAIADLRNFIANNTLSFVSVASAPPNPLDAWVRDWATFSCGNDRVCRAPFSCTGGDAQRADAIAAMCAGTGLQVDNLPHQNPGGNLVMLTDAYGRSLCVMTNDYFNSDFAPYGTQCAIAAYRSLLGCDVVRISSVASGFEGTHHADMYVSPISQGVAAVASIETADINKFTTDADVRDNLRTAQGVLNGIANAISLQAIQVVRVPMPLVLREALDETPVDYPYYLPVVNSLDYQAGGSTVTLLPTVSGSIQTRLSDCQWALFNAVSATSKTVIGANCAALEQALKTAKSTETFLNELYSAVGTVVSIAWPWQLSVAGGGIHCSTFTLPAGATFPNNATLAEPLPMPKPVDSPAPTDAKGDGTIIIGK